MSRTRTAAHLAALVAILLVWAAPSSVSALGLGYTIEMHDVTISGDAGRLDTSASFPVHRIRIVDTTGRLFSVFAAAVPTSIEAQDDGSELWTFEYQQFGAGPRITLEYAWMSDDALEVDIQGVGVEGQETEYREFRFSFGYLMAFRYLYLDMDFLDFIFGSGMEGDDMEYEVGAWRIGAELGPHFGPLRTGLFFDLDLTSTVDGIFEGTAVGFSWGPALHVDLPYFTVDLEYEIYRGPTCVVEPYYDGEGNKLGFEEYEGTAFNAAMSFEF